jgi:hypothetical protein
MAPVSSETTTMRASLSSERPTAARWRVPVLPMSRAERGKTQPAARMRSPSMMTPPSWRGVWGKKMVARSSAVTSGIEAGAGFLDGAGADFAFDGDEGADLVGGEAGDGLDDFVEHAAFAQGGGEDVLLAEFGEGAADFGLEDDDEGDDEVDGEALEEPVEGVEVEHAGEHEHDDDGGDEAEEDLGAAGAAEEEDGVIEEDGEDEDFEHAAHSGEGEPMKEIRPGAVHGHNLPRGRSGRSC